MASNGVGGNVKRSLAGGMLAVAFAVSTLLVPAVPAHAATTGISGSTAWGPCNWYTSNNVRYTSVANKQVRAKLSSTGKLGVKMRTKNENDGSVSAARYYPPLNEYQNFHKYSKKDHPFRLQFTCTNERKGTERPSTDFEGTLDY